MNARMSRLATLLVLLLSFGFGSHALASPVTKPALVRTAAQQARSEKLSELAKKRDRDEKGRFLPKVSDDAIRVRAYDKYEARKASGHGEDGHDKDDWAQAKRELQNEKVAKK
jgi:hypothetical protein